MASPYRSPAASPPNPAHTTIPNPRKRPQLVMPKHQSSLKRRKVSSFSTSTTTSAHPLRQTSFPPEESALSRDDRSPSVDSDYTAITGKQSVGASAIGGKKGKGKKRKIDGSVKSGTAKATGDARSVAELDVDEDGEEVDVDGEGEAGVIEDGAKVDRAAEKKKLAVLIDAFNDDQTERYNMYRRVKLKKETVRRITNQTLSQSVPPSVITTINGFAKVFIGTIIERAREVQKQQADAEKSLPSPSHATQKDPTSSPTLSDDATGPDKPEDLGPLLPDHFREALRRYKRAGEGGGAGVEGTSLGLGMSGTGSTRLGGKRLFR
ncbi:hypothetical protein MMC13_004455 [Lambiella insularis]|nr:hypothetical protein [Lambiella insularis]